MNGRNVWATHFAFQGGKTAEQGETSFCLESIHAGVSGFALGSLRAFDADTEIVGNLNVTLKVHPVVAHRDPVSLVFEQK